MCVEARHTKGYSTPSVGERLRKTTAWHFYMSARVAQKANQQYPVWSRM